MLINIYWPWAIRSVHSSWCLFIHFTFVLDLMAGHIADNDTVKRRQLGLRGLTIKYWTIHCLDCEVGNFNCSLALWSEMNVLNVSNCSRSRVVFVFEVRSWTELEKRFEGAWSDCLKISNYFFVCPWKFWREKWSWCNPKLLLIFALILIWIHIIMVSV